MAMAMPAVIGRSARPAAAVRTDPEDGRCRRLRPQGFYSAVAILVRPGGRTLHYNTTGAIDAKWELQSSVRPGGRTLRCSAG